MFSVVLGVKLTIVHFKCHSLFLIFWDFRVLWNLTHFFFVHHNINLIHDQFCLFGNPLIFLIISQLQINFHSVTHSLGVNADELYWSRSYTPTSGSIVESVPEFFKDIADQIFVCGKSLNLLKLCSGSKVNDLFPSTFHWKGAQVLECCRSYFFQALLLLSFRLGYRLCLFYCAFRQLGH